MTKPLTLPDFLSSDQIATCIALFQQHSGNSVRYIRQQVIEPNMTAIDLKIGQPNDATYLSYAVYYILCQCTDLTLLH